MDEQKPDMLSSLNDFLLILIISYLPFKDAVRTSVLSKCWRNLCYQTRNIQFREEDLVSLSGSDETKLEKRILFVRFMFEWVSRFYGNHIDGFELQFSKPVGFRTEIKSLIRFAVSKNVKNLVLDFSDSVSRAGVEAENQPSVVDLPPCAYEQTKLESLKLYACGLVASSFKNLTSLRHLSLGWLELGSVESLLLSAPLLETLTLKMCVNVNLVNITRCNERLKELVIDNCDFNNSVFYFDVPNLEAFKYSGDFRHFFFDRVNRTMQEACLDFGLETEFEENGDVLAALLHDLKSAVNLTVCTYLLQVVPSAEDPLASKVPLETRYLTLKASLQPREFLGIRFMLKSCPNLENLTLEMVPPRILDDYSPPFKFEPETFWEEKIMLRCVRYSLTVVEIKGFRGTLYDLQFLQYLLCYGRVMRRLELRISPGISQAERTVALAGADMVQRRFGRASKNVVITLHN